MTARQPRNSQSSKPILGQSNDGARVVELARDWIGTPYHHQAALKGVGCDCLGLVRGVWKEFHGKDAETPPPYSPDWGQVGTRETLIEAAKRHFQRRDLKDLKPGNVIVFRMFPHAIAKHCGVVSDAGRMIHAQEGVGVCEVALNDNWLRRAVAAFSFS